MPTIPGVPQSSMALAGVAGNRKDAGQPPSLAGASFSSRAAMGANPSFNPSTGQLSIQADAGELLRCFF
jgi:hypothetical protein